MLYALFFKGYVSKTDIQYEIAHVNILCSLVILTFLIFLHINYAMTPFKSNISRDKVQKITSVMFLWTISRYVKGNYDLLIILQPNVLIRNIYDIENATLTQAISLVLMLTLCEIICYVAVLDYSFMTIFLFPDDEVVQHAALFDPHGHTVIEEDEEKYLLPVRLSIMDASNPLIDFKEVIIIDTLAKKVHGFGEIFRATYKGREICYRKVNFKRMTTSVLEEITTEIGALKSIENPILVNFYGACFTLPSICVATSYMKNGSLFAYLHESNRILDYNQKLDLISSIARGIRDLHSQNKIHGHLSTHNVLLDDAYSPKISDLGLEKIKKYAGDLLGYENKNA